MTETKAFAALAPGGPVVPYTITRRACHANDVVIDIKFAGICHSDIHQVREEWGKAIFPMVPGHEIGGVVTQVGESVTKFKVGDTVGVGCMVDSCRSCTNCRRGEEQYCANSCVYTYNSVHRFAHCVECGTPTYGGYSKAIVVNQDFVLSIPSNLDLAAATPLLCAGITLYSPLIRFGLQANKKLGIVGMGGLGHMGVKLGVAMGSHTTVISRGTSKKETSLNDLHAHAFIDSTNAEEMNAVAGTFDLIICTISAKYDIVPYLKLLRTDGQFVVVGVPPESIPLAAHNLVNQRLSLAGSLIGGIRETQEMLDFCGRNDIVCDIELINADYINQAYDRAVNSDVKYRFVIDTASI